MRTRETTGRNHHMKLERRKNDRQEQNGGAAGFTLDDIESLFSDDEPSRQDDDSPIDLGDQSMLDDILGFDGDDGEMDDISLDDLLADDTDDNQSQGRRKRTRGKRGGRKRNKSSDTLQDAPSDIAKLLEDAQRVVEAGGASVGADAGEKGRRQRVEGALEPTSGDAPKAGAKTGGKRKPEPAARNKNAASDGRSRDGGAQQMGTASEQQVKGTIDIPTATSDSDMRSVVVPGWVGKNGLQAHFAANVSHAFLLDGNIGDYMVSNISIKDGIILTLDPKQTEFEVIAAYDQAHGLHFDAFTMYEKPNVTADEYKRRFVQMMKESQRRLRINVTDDVPTDPVELFEVIADIFDTMPNEGYSGRMLLFIDFLELLVPQGVQGSATMRPQEKMLAILLSGMCKSDMADRAGNCLVMTTNNITHVSDTIRQSDNRVDQITVPNPHYEERSDFIDNVLDVPENTLTDGRQIFQCEDGVSKEYLAVNTAGLACFQIEDIVLRALSADKPITTDLVKERKNEIIKNDYNDIIEIMEPKTGFEAVGGMEQIKRFFREEVIDPIHRHDLATVPMGVLLMGSPGTGKSVPKTTCVYKYDPSKKQRYLSTMGDVAVGDYVYGTDGLPTIVTGVFPQGMLPTYTVTDQCGRSVEASGNHLWLVSRKTHGVYKQIVLSTEELLEKGINDTNGGRKNRSRFHIPVASSIADPEVSHDVDPYVMGAFIGDGCCTSENLMLSSDDEFIVAEIARLIGASYYKRSKGSYSWSFYKRADNVPMIDDPINANNINLRNQKNLPFPVKRIKTSDIFGKYPEVMCYAIDKHIPSEYMVGSLKQRYALLQGLMDTDGSIQAPRKEKDKVFYRCNCIFSTTSQQLAEDVRTLLFGLGIMNTCTSDNRKGQTYIGGNGREYERISNTYNIKLRCPNEQKPLLFRVPRKKERAQEAAKHPKKKHYEHVGIASIESTGHEEDCVCISVASEDHCFLIGKDCIVTHNTMISKAVAFESHMNCINLNLNRLLSKYVGESERNLDRALQCAIDMQPTIIFIDEIDEALPKRHTGDNSGVTQRINKRLLEFFSDTTHRGKVIILAATNYPEKIDPAFKRAGRFDNRIPMFAPGVYDRVRLIKLIAKKTGYSISCLKDSDELIENPFHSLRAWLERGNVPSIEDEVYEMEPFTYEVHRQIGGNYTETSMVPKKLVDIVDRKTITYEQFYRCCDILFGSVIEERRIDDTTGMAESDEDYYGRIEREIDNSGEFLDDPMSNEHVNQKNRDRVHALLIYRDKYYKPFEQQTEGKTGAELEVTVQKAVSLFKRWKAEHPDREKQLLSSGVMKDENDIPWTHVINACRRTASAISGIKQMEDTALVDTSDTDFIPDEVYGETNNARKISYLERRETLLRRMTTGMDVGIDLGQ